LDANKKEHSVKKSTPPKRKASTQLKSAAPEIPKDLSDKWGAVAACATACNVLRSGMYSPEWLQAVTASHAFLLKLHEQAMTDILGHPQCDLIPELKEIKEKQSKGVQNGKATEETTAQPN
jgi:hypothetical protein